MRATMMIAASSGLALVLALWAHAGEAQSIVTDGTAGPAMALTGPDFAITQDLGTRSGGNLFHSFSEFGVPTGGSATFSGDVGIGAVIARVTGGAASEIDGALRSTIPSADLFLLNPAGVLFGPNASLDLQGGLAISTGDQITFTDGSTLAATGPINGFSSAPPSAFGFLGASAGTITVDGAALTLPDGQALTAAADAIRIEAGATVSAPEGAIHLATTQSAGTIPIDPASGLPIDAGAKTGTVTISDSSVSADAGAGEATGIDIATGTLTVDGGSQVRAGTTGAGTGGGIRIGAEAILIDGLGSDGETRTVVSSAALEGSTGAAGPISLSAPTITVGDGGLVESDSRGAGSAGPLTVVGETIVLEGFEGGGTLRFFSALGTESAPEVLSAQNASALDPSAALITVTTGDLILDDAGISTQTFGAGASGDIDITATRDVSLTGNSSIRTVTDIPGPSQTGNITINASSISLSDISEINTLSFGRSTGEIVLSAETVTLDGSIAEQAPAGSDPFFILGNLSDFVVNLSTNAFFTDGGSNSITINANTLTTTDVLVTTASVGAAGGGGPLILNVTGLADLGGGPSNFSSSSFGAEGFPDGPAGTIDVTAADLILGGQIEGIFPAGSNLAAITFTDGDGGSSTVNVSGTLTFENGGQILSDTLGVGNAGSILVTADRIDIDGASPLNGASGITSETTTDISDSFDDTSAVDDEAIGNSGTITVIANSLTISDAGQINTSSAGTGNAGSVTVSVGDLTITSNAATPTGISSSAGDDGDGGDVAVTASSILVEGTGATVAAASTGSGSAGAIGITTGALTVRDGGLVQGSTTDTGAAGTVMLDAGSVLIDAGTLETVAGTSVPQTGGMVTLDAGTVVITNGGEISSANTGLGDAGGIVVTADGLTLDNGGTVNTASAAGGGGSISLVIDGVTQVLSGSAITASVATGAGGGGDVVIDSTVLLSDTGAITATAVDGVGGTIALSGDLVIVTPTTTISASSAFGVDGTVTVIAPEGESSGNLVAIEARPTDASDNLQPGCADRALAGQINQFQVAGAGGVPPRADGLRWSGLGRRGDLRPVATLHGPDCAAQGG